MSEHADMIQALDEKYHYDSPDAITCPNEGEPARLPQSGFVSRQHGAMCVHISGNMLVCGRCGETTPTSPVS